MAITTFIECPIMAGNCTSVNEENLILSNWLEHIQQKDAVMSVK